MKFLWAMSALFSFAAPAIAQHDHSLVTDPDYPGQLVIKTAYDTIPVFGANSHAPGDVHVHAGQVYEVQNERVQDVYVEYGGKIVLKDHFYFAFRNLSIFGEIVSDGEVEGVFEINGQRFEDWDHHQWGIGILNHGKWDVRGKNWNKLAYSQLQGNAQAGMSTLVVAGTAGWQVGDEVGIADTEQKVLTKLNKFGPPERTKAECRRIVGIFGNQVALDAPLAHDHPAAYYFDNNTGVLVSILQPHLVNLTRSVKITSTGAIRGHIAHFHAADVDAYGIEITNCGRTVSTQPPDTAFKFADGTWYVPKNQNGRYAHHNHHLFGVEGGHPSRYQCRLVGMVVRDAPRWGYTVHDSHYGLLQYCVSWGAIGAGFMTENGSEFGNSFLHCYAGNTLGTGSTKNEGVDDGPLGKGTHLAMDGSGFWFRTGGNRVTGCVSEGSRNAAYNYNGYRVREMWIPIARGSHQTTRVLVMPFGGFSNNKALGARWGLWDVLDCGPKTELYQRRELSDSIFGNVNIGVDAYHSPYTDFTRLTFLSTPAVASLTKPTNLLTDNSIGIHLADRKYENGGHSITGCVIAGFVVGIGLPHNQRVDDPAAGIRTPPLVVQSCELSNYTNVVATGLDGQGEVLTILRGNIYRPNSGVDRVANGKFSMPESETDLMVSDSLGLATVQLEDYFNRPVRVRTPKEPSTMHHPRIIGSVRQ